MIKTTFKMIGMAIKIMLIIVLLKIVIGFGISQYNKLMASHGMLVPKGESVECHYEKKDVSLQNAGFYLFALKSSPLIENNKEDEEMNNGVHWNRLKLMNVMLRIDEIEKQGEKCRDDLRETANALYGSRWLLIEEEVWDRFEFKFNLI